MYAGISNSTVLKRNSWEAKSDVQCTNSWNSHWIILSIKCSRTVSNPHSAVNQPNLKQIHVGGCGKVGGNMCEQGTFVFVLFYFWLDNKLKCRKFSSISLSMVMQNHGNCFQHDWLIYIFSFQALTVQMMIVPARVMKCHGNKYGCHLTVILITMLSGKKITGQFVSVGDILRYYRKSVLYIVWMCFFELK